MSESEKRIVKKTWKYLARDMSAIGARVFLRIFEINPDLKQLFPFRNDDGESLRNDPNFTGHASRFMQAVGAANDNIHNLEAFLGPLLIGLGKQHIKFGGFKPEYWDVFTEAMLFVWERELGEDFNDKCRYAWTKVFDFIMEQLKEGYRLAEEEELEQNPNQQCHI
jgi:hemoglobin-like flavoprotein